MHQDRRLDMEGRFFGYGGPLIFRVHLQFDTKDNRHFLCIIGLGFGLEVSDGRVS